MKPFPIKLDDELVRRIKLAADRLRKKDQEVMRESMRIGLEYFARIGYDVESAVIDKADAAQAPLTRAPAPDRVTEIVPRPRRS